MPEKELTLRIGRREFSREAVIAILSAATITIADCGGGGSSNPSPSPSPTPTPGDVTGPSRQPWSHGSRDRRADYGGQRRDARHSRDRRSPAQRGLECGGSRDDWQRQTVAKTSSNDDGHMHTVTFN